MMKTERRREFGLACVDGDLAAAIEILYGGLDVNGESGQTVGNGAFSDWHRGSEPIPFASTALSILRR